jgi:hypothetical protein
MGCAPTTWTALGFAMVRWDREVVTLVVWWSSVVTGYGDQSMVMLGSEHEESCEPSVDINVQDVGNGVLWLLSSLFK